MAKVQLSADFYPKKDGGLIYLHLRSDKETLTFIKQNLFKQATFSNNNLGDNGKSVPELTSKFPANKAEDFLNSGFIDRLYSGLAQNHIETNISPEVFKEDIMVAGKSAPNPKKVKIALEKRDNLLEKFFQHYDDAEVRREIAKIAQSLKINANGEVWKKALVSSRNKLLAYVQNPNCTYIASQKTWRDVFNRRVKGTAKPIYIIAGNNAGKHDDYATDVLGMNRQQASANRHNYAAFSKVSRYGDTNPTDYFVTVYYDYADTELYDVDYDPFNDDPGLSSNLNGDYNQKANEKNLGSDAEVNRQNIRKMIGSENYVEKAQIAFDNVVNYCNNHNDIYSSVLILAKDKEPSEGITDVLREMFRISFERVHDKKLQDEKVNVCTCFVLANLEIANNSMINYMAANGNKFNKKDLLSMYSQCMDMMDILVGLKESIKVHPTFKEFLNALDTTFDGGTDAQQNRDDLNYMINNDTTENTKESENENNDDINHVRESIINFMNRMML